MPRNSHRNARRRRRTETHVTVRADVIPCRCGATSVYLIPTKSLFYYTACTNPDCRVRGWGSKEPDRAIEKWNAIQNRFTAP